MDVEDNFNFRKASNELIDKIIEQFVEILGIGSYQIREN